MKQRVIIAGGGTGGHIFPGLAIAESLQRQLPAVEIHFVGTRYGMETRLIPPKGFPLHALPMRGLLGKSTSQRLALIWRLPASLVGAFWLLLRLRPRVVIGVGGYAALPIMTAAGLLRIPSMIQEQNAFPGLTNRMTSRMAGLACLGFPEASCFLKCPSLVTGNPIRRDFHSVSPWSPQRNTWLVLGGSQGARALDTILPKLLIPAIASVPGLRLVHQCRRDHVAQVQENYKQAPFPVEVTPFIHDLPARFEKVRCVVARAGASTVSELQAARMPAVLIPFPAATHDHQTHNARSLARSGGAVVISENELPQAGHTFAELIHHPASLETMARACSPPSRISADLCAEVAIQLASRRSIQTIIEEHPSHVS